LARKKQTSGIITLEEKIALGFISLFHSVGAGLLIFSKGGIYQIALDLVPINLIFTSLVVFKYQDEFNAGFFKFLIVVYLMGVGIEMIGVNYGWLFGPYEYGAVLGFSIWNTPLLIGVNWVLLCYSVGCFVEFFQIPEWLKWTFSVLLLLVFDYFMEPIAMKHNFWMWVNGSIPNQNYVGWAITAAIFMYFFRFFSFSKKNKVAGFVWLIQLCFFLVKNAF